MWTELWTIRTISPIFLLKKMFVWRTLYNKSLIFAFVTKTNTTMDWLKSLGRGVAGIAILAAFLMCSLGTLAILILEDYYQFAVATAVVLTFAAPQMYKTFQKLLL